MSAASLLSGTLLLALSAQAASPDFIRSCETELPPPLFQVERIDNGFSIEHNLSSAALTGLGARARKHSRNHVLGLTRAETAATVSIHLARLIDHSTGEECVSPAVRVVIAYQPMKVFVGSEFPDGSCSYREILSHEMRHVRAYLDHLPKVEAAVRVQGTLRFEERIRYGQRGVLEAELADQINAYWLPLLESEIDKVEEDQARIDTLEEYQRMEEVCGGEVVRLMQPGK